MPQEIPKARREWRQRRRQQSRARYGLRRLLGMLSILLVLLVGILFLPALIGQRPVARLHVPTAEAVPKPPVTEPQADSRASSQIGSEASTPTVPVKTELTAERKDPLRNELQRIARAYPATYGVVIFDPSSKETLAMGADQKFGAACLGKLPVLMALYRVAAAGQVDLDTRSLCNTPTCRLTAPASSIRTS